MKATLPTPSAYLYTAPRGGRVVDLKCFDLNTPGLTVSGLITVEQAKAYADARVREVLEDAAQACEARIGQHAPGMTPEDVEDCDEEARLCAGAIRALIK
ncbi:hypothetical protein CSC67_08500 [Pusillimonas caeni]|uniref:hypothetical protein n=1 Tax=Pusillimonas caeni TaxID=1348472 RepID=UPI000E59C6DE|nr:hypothetical protein [Pusillimonas caeni]TFL14182.1 hypothetical protein CSC67_08500 [Pusillimonas caeni]